MSGLFLPTKADHEHSTRLAALPSLLRHAAGDRAIAGPLYGDAGLPPISPFDECIGLTRAFAAALDDPCDPDLTERTFLEMVHSRVYGILTGYDEQNDHHTLRADPVLKLITDRSPEDDDLANQPTLSRFENAI